MRAKLPWSALVFALPLITWAISAHLSPFVQHERANQARVAVASENVLKTILDPSWNGHGDSPGRFRFVEYVAELLYWKAISTGGFGQPLWDVLAVVVNLLCMLLLGRVLTLLRVGPGMRFASLALFCLSAPVLQTIAFNYRSAKYLVTLELSLMVWVLMEGKFGRALRVWAVGTLGALGFITDPYFVLAAPLLLLSMTHAFRLSWRTTLIPLTLGYAMAIAGVWVVNGWIAPQLYPHATLFPPPDPGLWNQKYFAWAGLLKLDQLCADVVFPFRALHGFWRVLLVGLAILPVVRAWRRRPVGQERWIFWIGPVAGLFAFIYQPDSSMRDYTGYYAHTFLWIALAMTGAWIGSGQAQTPGQQRWAAWVFALLIGSQVLGREAAFRFRVQRHIGSCESRFESGVRSLERVNQQLREATPDRPVVVRFPKSAEALDYCTPHQLDYVERYLFPAFFRREIRSGLLKFEFVD